MMHAAEGLQCAAPKLHRIAIVIFDVVHDVGRHGTTFGFADLTQRLGAQMQAATFAPARGVIRTAAIVTAAFRIKEGGIRVHAPRHGGGCWRGRRVGARLERN
jgi:hypothetical protein